MSSSVCKIARSPLTERSKDATKKTIYLYLSGGFTMPNTNTSELLAQLPDTYVAPALVEYGELRQMIRGSGSPTSADFSSLDDPADGVNTSIGQASDDGNQLPDSDCNTYFPF